MPTNRLYTLPVSLTEGTRITVDTNYRGLETGTVTMIESDSNGTTVEYVTHSGEEYWCYVDQIKAIEANSTCNV